MISEEQKSKIIYWSRTAVLLTGLAASFTSILLFVGYLGWLGTQGNQAACEAAFGPTASYIGDVSGGSGIICTTPDGPKLTDGQTKRIGLRTLSNYIDAVLAGNA